MNKILSYIAGFLLVLLLIVFILMLLIGPWYMVPVTLLIAVTVFSTHLLGGMIYDYFNGN